MPRRQISTAPARSTNWGCSSSFVIDNRPGGQHDRTMWRESDPGYTIILSACPHINPGSIECFDRSGSRDHRDGVRPGSSRIVAAVAEHKGFHCVRENAPGRAIASGAPAHDSPRSGALPERFGTGSRTCHQRERYAIAASSVAVRDVHFMATAAVAKRDGCAYRGTSAGALPRLPAAEFQEAASWMRLSTVGVRRSGPPRAIVDS